MDATHWKDRYATAEHVWKTDPNIFLAAEAATPDRSVRQDVPTFPIDVDIHRRGRNRACRAGATNPLCGEECDADQRSGDPAVGVVARERGDRESDEEGGDEQASRTASRHTP